MDVENIINKYNDFLNEESITDNLFEITDELVKQIYFKYVHPLYKIQHLTLTERKYKKLISTQLNYTRLSLLRVKYFRNGNSATSIKEGFVYLLSNPSFRGYYKIGSTIDLNTRLKVYQGYCPERNFKIESYYFSHDRFKEEAIYHRSLDFKGEWCNGDIKPIKFLFDSKKILGCIAQR